MDNKTYREVKKMEKTNKKEDKSTWAIGGCLLVGIGVGFFFVRENPMALVACLLVGLGMGLLVTAILSKVKNGE